MDLCPYDPILYDHHYAVGNKIFASQLMAIIRILLSPSSLTDSLLSANYRDYTLESGVLSRRGFQSGV
ncbi:hypothetical protein SBA4_180039 [Candidatus Sulfopaludibacter sp. SbA4]|nr:hypothetical protein SBA4_180039 [Candidatus Sulfopaludibacter sp. SbA4]